MALNRWTPWGFSDHAEEIAPGIVSYSTPGHGGYHLSEEREAQMHPALRKTEATYCPLGWYEEDCEAALVGLAFRHLPCFEKFGGIAEGMVRSVYPEKYAAWKS